MSSSITSQDTFDWQPQPEAAALVQELFVEFVSNCDVAMTIAARLLNESGTRLLDWVDHLGVVSGDSLAGRLSAVGFVADQDGELTIWSHPRGIFPRIVSGPGLKPRLAIRVESTSDFVTQNQFQDAVGIEGATEAPLRQVLFHSNDSVEMWAVERHADRGFSIASEPQASADTIRKHREALGQRNRNFDPVAAGFEYTRQLINTIVADLDTDRTCDLFFAAERHYWQSRNHAGRIQKARQDVLGLGWANHDHHTFRSSREHFARLIALLEQLGFHCRERFYAGEEARWGAQVLEQPACGLTVFADVDLLPEEIEGDFSHEGLDPLPELGTIGLWCQLHGESLLAAGMHHLECQFHFNAAREQLAGEGIETMAPFTDLPHLKQAFTCGEMWPVDPQRIDALLRNRRVTKEHAAEFRTAGALGSHLEILQRSDGFKGFNQTGISEIIRKTDPRKVD